MIENVKRNTIYLILLGCLAIIIIILLFKNNDKTIPNYATVIGTVGSLIGLAIAYLNIVALKKTALITAIQIEKTLQQVNQLNSISDVSKAIKTNQEIQNYIRNGKIELAHLRTLDLKYMLLQFNYNSQLKQLTINEEYQQLVIDFSIDLNSLNDHLITPRRKVDFSKVTKNLENLSTFLTQFENKLKTLNI